MDIVREIRHYENYSSDSCVKITVNGELLNYSIREVSTFRRRRKHCADYLEKLGRFSNFVITEISRIVDSEPRYFRACPL